MDITIGTGGHGRQEGSAAVDLRSQALAGEVLEELDLPHVCSKRGSPDFSPSPRNLSEKP